MPDFYTHSSGLTASREQLLTRHRLVAARAALSAFNATQEGV